MTVLTQVLKPLAIGLIAVVVATGCATSSLHKGNRRYANPSKEFRSLGERISGTYVGTQYRDGRLSEVYQFANPFKHTGGCDRFEVTFPLYGATENHPVRGYETNQVAYAGEPAELWLWWDQKDVPSEGKVTRDAKGRRIDVLWQSGKPVAARRFVPEAKTFTIAQRRQVAFPIPWRERSRLNYSLRNAAYVPTLVADAAAGIGIGVGCAALAVGYVALECPELVCLIICAID